jgi:indole-3-glycerol phosphate synthase
MKFTIVDKIVDRVEQRLSADKVRLPVSDLKRRVADARPAVSFSESLSGPFGLIAEIKRCSPSRGLMHHQDIEDVARTYQDHSFVRAVSVLTNRDDFGMSIEDLAAMRKLISKPILRKDFIFDEYQVYEARAFGADAILLMASIVTDANLMRGLFDLSRELGMDVLFECRDKAEIDAIPSGAKVYGINSRKLGAKTFFGLSRYTWAKWFDKPLGLPDSSVQRRKFQLANYIPDHALKVAESGVTPGIIAEIRDQYNSALVGTAILNAPEGVRATLDTFSSATSEKCFDAAELLTSR